MKSDSMEEMQKQVCLFDGASSPPSQRETGQDCLGTKKE